MAEVILKEITKKFGNITALNKINLEIKDKDFFVIVGPSGSGKTTILRLIAGLEQPTQGEIFIDNKNVNNVLPKDRDIAMVFQNFTLYPHMNVYDNMSFGLKMKKFNKQEIDSRVRSAAELLNITHLLYRKPKELSIGEKQRVAIGRTIVRNPKVFLFDEPLSNLDAKLRTQMRIELKKLYEKLGSTVIYVTHNQNEAMTLAKRLCVLKNGEVQQVGTQSDIFNFPSNMFVASFIGTPPMNFFELDVIRTNENMYFSNCNIKLTPDDTIKQKLITYNLNKIILGVRPENIYPVLNIETENVIESKIDFVEQIGTEIYVYMTINKKNFIARWLNTNIQIKPGNNIRVVFDMQKINIFHPETEQLIT